ncbi:hypothetical protein V8C37DRAFT_370758 [Trichoderma ceciliae]
MVATCVVYFLFLFGRGRWILGGIVYVGIAHSNQVPSCRNQKKLYIEIVSVVELVYRNYESWKDCFLVNGVVYATCLLFVT